MLKRLKYQVHIYSFLLCMAYSPFAFSKALILPEYSPLKTLIFPLENYDAPYLGERSLPLMWQEFLTRVALESNKQSIELSLLIDASNPDHCNKDTRFFDTAYKSQYAPLLEFEQNFLSQCSAQQDTCDTSKFIYICAEKQKRWLRNTDYMHSIKHNGESIFINLLQTRTSSELIPPSADVLSIPLKWNGPADIISDRLGGNLFVTSRMLKSNAVNPEQLEETLHQYLEFERLFILKANPWEYTQDTDTIVTFAKHPQSQDVHAFLTKHPHSQIRRSLSNSAYLKTDFLSLGQISNKEQGKCDISSQYLQLMSFFALNRWNDPFHILSPRFRKSELLRGHASQDDFLNYAREQLPQFSELYSCYQDIHADLNETALNNDTYNYETLLDAGFRQNTIHWVESPGIYSNPKKNTYVPSYVNGVIINNSYLMPSFPAFSNPDRQVGRNQAQIQQAFEELSSADQQAMNVFSTVFDRVISIRSDFLNGGAVHCTSSCRYKP